MGARIRAFDWEKSPLGPISGWPQSLKTTIDLMMASQLAMNLIWGPERNLIYNEVHRAFMGTKHPRAFGRPGREVWGEAWEAAEAIHRRVFAGETVTLDDHPWMLLRNGGPEEAFFTSYFTPIRDETGAVVANLATAFETTKAVKEKADRDRAEHALRDSEARLREVLEGIGEAFYALDQDQRFLYASRKALETWGKKSEDLIGRPFLEVFPHAVGTPGYKAHLRALETDEAQHLELVSPLLGRWFEVDVYPSSNGISVAFRDVEQRKEAEAALIANEARLKAAVELVGVSPYSGDPRTGTLDWDARLKAMWGLPADTPVDAPMAVAAIHPDDQARVEAAWEASFDPAGGGVFVAEYRVLGIEDGVERWVSTHAQNFFEHRQPVRFIGAIREITAEKRAEARLRGNEARLQAAVDLLGLGLYRWDPQTNALEWDARVKAIWGLPPGARVDYDIWRQGVHPDDLARVEAEIAKCTDPNGDGVYRIEYRVNGSDGVQRWVVTRGRTTFRESRPVDFVGIAIDITERKHSEARLLESEARLSGILQQLPVGVGLVDREGRFLLRGGLLGGLWAAVMPSQDPGQNTRWRSYHPDGRLLLPPDYPGARALRGETVLPGTDFVYTADDGHETWVRVSAAPFRNAAGEIEGAVTILQDVDAEKRTEQAMRESEERFRGFAEHSSNVLWILDTDTRALEYLSPAYEAVWGQQADATRNYWLESVHPDDRDRTAAGLERGLQGDLVVQEYRIVRPDHKVRSIRDTMFPIRDQNGRMRSVGGIAQEIGIHDGMRAYIVDPNAKSQEDLSHLLQRAGYAVKGFASSAEFLQVAPVLASGCAVFDIRSSYADGLDVLRQLRGRGSDLPVVVTGMSNGDVTLAVQVMKAGAADWLELPYDDDTMLIAVASALAGIRRSEDQHKDAELARVRVASMSGRERQVLEGLLAGGTNKLIGRELGISPRTVELHRSSVMERLGVSTLPEAVLMAAAAGVRPSSRSRKAKPPRKSP